MIIQSGNVGMSAKRSYYSHSYSNQSLQVWGKGSALISPTLAGITTATDKQKNASQSSSAKHAIYGDGNNSNDFFTELQNRYKPSQKVSRPLRTGSSDSLKDLQKIRQRTLSYILDLLFSKERRWDYSSAQNLPSDSTENNFGGQYTAEFYYEENENVSFSTEGMVKTSDGKEISFQLDLTLSRSFVQYSREAIDFGAPRMMDPLVINLDSPSANVSDQKFYFDLDGDGHEESISSLGAGSGFLALDKNGDGIINDGSELFGTKSGNGFEDLSAFDLDKNGWIDEADDIFDKLLVWTKDENGNDKLIDLKKAGVGAIYLGAADTQFSLNDTGNRTNALIQKSGIFLYESGRSGTIQQVDLAT
ncbi:MAG: hypothetical protein PUD20_02520 [bacterium]|nr:hypothetical protein [bacterium]